MWRTVEVDLRRHLPFTAVEADKRVSDALDGQRRRHGRQHGIVVEDRQLGHGRPR
jgi:hypothetical protein